MNNLNNLIDDLYITIKSGDYDESKIFDLANHAEHPVILEKLGDLKELFGVISSPNKARQQGGEQAIRQSILNCIAVIRRHKSPVT